MILAVTALITLELLLVQLMGDRGSNEVDVLPLARHYADSSWIPGDWYLNQPPGYRLLFQALFGKLAAGWGFLATCLIGRLICYTLVASGIVLIGQKLGLSLHWLLLAVVLFLSNQSLAAGEWLVGGLEAKSVAYGLVLLAIGLMLDGRFVQMILALGLATSFHVLVGVWAFLAVVAWLSLRQKTFLMGIRFLGLLTPLYLISGAFGVGAVIEQLFTPTPTGSVIPSQVYVFLRLPHHLNPLSWPAKWWLDSIIYMLVLAVSVALFCYWRQSHKLSGLFRRQHVARVGLAEFTLLSMVPFVLGLAIAPFDAQGSLLQYYPFRLGDVMLPLNACLLFACVLEQAFTGRMRQLLLLGCVAFLSWKCATQIVTFKNQLLALPEFPNLEQNIAPQWQGLCNWVRNHTPQNATVITPPVEFADFTWLAERATVAKFKLLPQSKAGIIDWYERISDLGGDLSHWLQATPDFGKGEIEEALTNTYNSLTTEQAAALMTKYQADYFVTRVEHQLNLPTVYSNSLYVLYGKPQPS